MRRIEECRAKVTDDSGIRRGRVPCPLLQEMRARPGDYLTFRLADSGEVVVRLLRSRKRSGKAKSKRS